jgi:DNA-binding CsgD family transcriptional regulator
MAEAQRTTTSPSFAAGGSALVGFARSLSEAESLVELERAFTPRFGRLMTAPMYGFYALDEDGADIEHNVGVNVSDYFIGRYLRAMEVDPLLAESRATGGPVYNLGLMSQSEWAESEVYRGAYSIHRMQHVIEVPITDGGRVIGALHCAASETDRNFTDNDLRLAEAAAGVLAISIARIRRRQEGERALDEALAALELTGAAIVATDEQTASVRPNEAARRLLADVLDGDQHVYELLARVPGQGRFSRRARVSLRSGESAVLHADSQPVRDGGLVTVLELQRDAPGLDQRLLGTLTPRESEVAVLVVEGLSDREIAERLYLSRFTVSQHVKRIYRTLDVDSRVALTRLLLGAPISVRRS